MANENKITAEELQAINEALEAELKAKTEELEKVKAAVSEQARTGRPVSTEPTEFKIGKEVFKFPAPKFSLPGFGVMTATQALENKEVLKRLAELQKG